MAILSIINVLLLVIASLMRNIGCAEPKVKEECFHFESKLHCYVLYGSNTSKVTWNTASNECEHDGGQLVRIKSSEIQGKLLEVFKPITNVGGTVHVWTAGKRSNDTNWYYVNNTKPSQDVIDKLAMGASGDRCAYIQNTSNSGQLAVGSCYDNRMAALCQYPAPCDPDDVSYKDLCYHLYRDQQKIDWNRARQYCREKQGRDLAYLHVTNTSLLLLLNSTNDIWIGLSSITWTWVTPNASEMRMEYTKFRGGAKTGSCVYIDPNDHGKWDSDDCEYKNKYFVCEVTKLASTVTIKTTSVSTATVTATSNDSFTTTYLKKNVAPKQNNSNRLTSLDNIIIYCVIGSLVLIIAIVVIGVCVRRRKKSVNNVNGTALPAYGSHIEASSDSKLADVTANNHGHGLSVENHCSVLPTTWATSMTGSDYSEIPANVPPAVTASSPPAVASSSLPVVIGSDYSEIPANLPTPVIGNVYSKSADSQLTPMGNNKALSMRGGIHPVTSSEAANNEATDNHGSQIPSGYKVSSGGDLYALPKKVKT